MPLYTQNVGFNAPPQVAVSGQPAYFFGSMPWDTQDTIMQVTNVALTSNVATLTVTVLAGNIPAVGQLVTVQGTQNTSGLFNVSAVALTGVTITASTGQGTITFALTHANVSSTADAGKAYVPIQETSEVCQNGASVAIYVPAQEPVDFGAKTITVSSIFPSLPTAATLTLYTAINNNPIAAGTNGSEWTSMGVVGTVAGGVQTVGPLKTFTTPAGRWFQVVASSVTGGTSPTMIVKMLS